MPPVRSKHSQAEPICGRHCPHREVSLLQRIAMQSCSFRVNANAMRYYHMVDATLPYESMDRDAYAVLISNKRYLSNTAERVQSDQSDLEDAAEDACLLSHCSNIEHAIVSDCNHSGIVCDDCVSRTRDPSQRRCASRTRNPFSVRASLIRY